MKFFEVGGAWPKEVVIAFLDLDEFLATKTNPECL